MAVRREPVGCLDIRGGRRAAEDDDGHAGKLLIRPHRRQHLAPRHSRHLEVEQHEVRASLPARLAKKRHGLLPVATNLEPGSVPAGP